jgi:glyoxylase-like metal-dependent hydrolase (beta-lactamase superfamily II)
MKICDGIYLIASGSAGCGLSNPFDCDVYLVEASAGTEGSGPQGPYVSRVSYVIVDCGAGLEPERIKQNLEESGHRPEDCAAILLTHSHADHSGGAAWLSGYTGAKVYALDETAAYVTNGDLDAMALPQAIRAGVYPADYRFRPCEVFPVEADKPFDAGGIPLFPAATPGHAKGHCAWLAEAGGRRCLFSGDLVFADGKISLLPTWDCSPAEYMGSIEKAASLDFGALFPSHHGFLLERGKAPVISAQRYFQRLALPPWQV